MGTGAGTRIVSINPPKKTEERRMGEGRGGSLLFIDGTQLNFRIFELGKGG